MVAIPWAGVASAGEKIISAARDISKTLAVLVFYLLILGYCGLAITILQIRQEVGADFDIIEQKLNLDQKLADDEVQLADYSTGADASANDPSAAHDRLTNSMAEYYKRQRGNFQTKSRHRQTVARRPYKEVKRSRQGSSETRICDPKGHRDI